MLHLRPRGGFLTADLIIRDMRYDDLPTVAAMEKELFSDPWPVSIFREDINSDYSYPLVAQSDNAIVGYAIIWVGVNEGHLTNIAVAKPFQRKSIAKKLLSYILRLAADMELAQVLLEVRPSNQPAIFLYKSFGFEQMAVRKKYYNKPIEDCLVMRKVITGDKTS